MNIFTNVPLSDIVYYKIGGPAKFLLKVQNKQDFIDAITYIQTNNITKILPIGLGSNLLIADTGFDGAVIWFAKPPEEEIFHTQEGIVTAFASMTLDDVIQYSFKHNLVGLEWAGGLPSTIGAAIRGNVGCFGTEIQDIFYQAEVCKINHGKIEYLELQKEDMNFSYRESVIKQNRNLFVTSVSLALTPGDTKALIEAKAIYDANRDYRVKNHPVEYPSCGSVFKNIVLKEQVEKILLNWPDIRKISEEKWHNKISMGYVINRLGFSNYQIGGARVSEKHANYINNINNASFKDVCRIIYTIHEKFLETFGFAPDTEVQIVP